MACILDLDGSILEMNQSLHFQIYGNNASTFKTFKELLLSEDRALFEDLLRSLPQKTQFTLDLRTLSQENQWNSCAWNFVLIEDLILAKTTSISEALLIKSNERFSAIVNNIPVMLSFFDTNGNFEWVNTAWTSELGWDLQSMNGRDMMAEFYPDSNIRNEVFDFMRSGSKEWRDFYIRKKDNTSIHTSWANVCLSTGQKIGIGQNISLRKSLKEDLRRAHEKLTMALDFSGIGIIEFFENEQYFCFDKAWGRLLGLKEPGGVLSVQFMESLVHPEDWSELKNLFSLPQNNNKNSNEGTFRFQHANQEWKWLKIRVKPSEKGFLALSFDITEQMNSELALNNAIQSLEFILQGGGVGSWDWWVKTNQVSFDERWCSMLGLDIRTVKQELSTWDERVHPDDKEKVYADIKRHVDGYSEYYENIHRVKHHNGNWIWILDRGMIAERDKNGHPIRFSGTHLDITQIKDMERQLEDAQRMAKIGSWSYDSATGKFNCSKEFEKIFELDRSHFPLSTEKINEYIHPEDVEKFIQVVQKALGDGQPYKMRYRKKDTKGQYIWLESHTEITRDSQNGVHFIFGTVQDITESVFLEAEKKKAEIQLVNSAKMASLGEMAGGIAHEINNPLTIIQAKASYIKKRIEQQNIDPEKLMLEIDKVYVMADRIAKIVRGLRTFSREGSADPMLPTKIAEIIDDAVGLCIEKFRFHGIHIEVSGDTQDKILCRSSQISQVFLNLLSNAYDAVKDLEEKWVHLEVKKNQRYLFVTVTDSGTGISPALQEKLMQPFFTTKAVGLGTGLGLSISKGIIEDHKGHLYYDAGARNTRFIIELPLA